MSDNIIKDEYIRNFIYRNIGYYILENEVEITYMIKQQGVVTKIFVSLHKHKIKYLEYVFGYGIFGKKSIALEEKRYYKDEKLHNEDGPAHIIYHPREFYNNKNKPPTNIYFLDGISYLEKTYNQYRRNKIMTEINKTDFYNQNGTDIVKLVTKFII
jgi:hypothetical protein